MICETEILTLSASSTFDPEWWRLTFLSHDRRVNSGREGRMPVSMGRRPRLHGPSLILYSEREKTGE